MVYFHVIYLIHLGHIHPKHPSYSILDLDVGPMLTKFYIQRNFNEVKFKARLIRVILSVTSDLCFTFLGQKLISL